MTISRDPSGRVADAPSNSWVYRVLPAAAWPYAQLSRLDRPIGWQLLMWPCFWSATLAANVAARQGQFSLHLLVWHLVLFFIGAVAMRGAGCTWNDIVDHRIDEQVARTRSRPLPSGRVSRSQAKLYLVAQALVGLVVLLQFNRFAILLGLSSLLIVALYPFAKRVTYWPQSVLGLAFSWGALMGWAGVFGSLSAPPLLLFAGAVVWTIGYDTIYAHQDREDDALVGVKSTALLFGARTRQMLMIFYGAMLVLIGLCYTLAGLPVTAWFGLVAAASLLLRQIAVIDIDNADECLALFKSNSRVGGFIFAGLTLPLIFSAF